MPLLKGNSEKIKKQNYLELLTGSVSEVRKKAIQTIMKRRRISYEAARAIQARAIVR